MPKDDSVGCFHPGSDRKDGPDFLMPRVDLRQWKDEGRGFFCDHGQHFQLVAEVPVELLGHGNLIPFGRVPSKILKPKPVNYPIPALGDHRMRWQYSFMILESRKATCY